MSILVLSDGPWAREEYEFGNIRIVPMYRKMNKVERIILLTKLRMDQSISVSDFNQDIKDYDPEIIIVLDGRCRLEYLRWLRSTFRTSDIIVYYWNSIEEAGRNLDPNEVAKGCRVCSFSRYDSEHYNLAYADTFFPYYTKLCKSYSEDYDVYFCGKDKGRLNTLLEYEKCFSEQNISYKFRICSTKREIIRKSIHYTNRVPYAKMLEELSRCRAVLDCVVNENAGMTLRPLEAIFSGKKLITDNQLIKKEKIYNPAYVHILYKDNISELKQFIDKDVPELDRTSLVQYYSIPEWVSRVIRAVQ